MGSPQIGSDRYMGGAGVGSRRRNGCDSLGTAQVLAFLASVAQWALSYAVVARLLPDSWKVPYIVFYGLLHIVMLIIYVYVELMDPARKPDDHR